MLLPNDWFHTPVSNHIQYARIRSHILESYLRCMCVSYRVYLSAQCTPILIKCYFWVFRFGCSDESVFLMYVARYVYSREIPCLNASKRVTRLFILATVLVSVYDAYIAFKTPFFDVFSP